VRLAACCRELRRISKSTGGLEIHGDDFVADGGVKLCLYLSMPITNLRILNVPLCCPHKLATHPSIRSVDIMLSITTNNTINYLNPSRIRELQLYSSEKTPWKEVMSLPLLDKLTVIFRSPQIPTTDDCAHISHQGLQTLSLSTHLKRFYYRDFVIPIHRFYFPSLMSLHVGGGMGLPCIHLIMHSLPPTLTALDIENCDLCEDYKCDMVEPSMQLTMLHIFADSRHPRCRSILHTVIRYACKFQTTLTSFMLAAYVGNPSGINEHMLLLRRNSEEYKLLQALPTTLRHLQIQVRGDSKTLALLSSVLKPLVHLENFHIQTTQQVVSFASGHDWITDLFSNAPSSCLVSFDAIEYQGVLSMSGRFASRWRWDRTRNFVAPQTFISYELWNRHIVNTKTNIISFSCFDIDGKNVDIQKQFNLFYSKNKQIRLFWVITRFKVDTRHVSERFKYVL
jgi:hypothetical protein